MIEIIGLDKAMVLAALYNASKPQGMGFMQFDAKPMTVDEARNLLAGGTSFDYLKGRVMKVDLKRGSFEEWGYDRDNGQGAAMRAVDAVRAGETNSKSIQEAHAKGTLKSAAVAEKAMQEPTTMANGVMRLGLSGVKHHLAPEVEKITRSRN